MLVINDRRLQGDALRFLVGGECQTRSDDGIYTGVDRERSIRYTRAFVVLIVTRMSIVYTGVREMRNVLFCIILIIFFYQRNSLWVISHFVWSNTDGNYK